MIIKSHPAMRTKIATVLKSMADPHRIDILFHLRRSELCVTELVERLGVSQANVSKHLSVLQSAGLISHRRDGVRRYYCILDPTVFSICDAVCETVERRIKTDSNMLVDHHVPQP